ncbi:MAG: type III-B CRISPR module RAMP protein Cmr1, partial [Chloroflexia bacterium]|nr:type III-B CRISPR module RAMP protein Cmr1 [Chloroflexia bacterium]
MPQLQVTLETVTPLFLGGADGRSAELRPSSFRGALRFWLRALLGAHIGNDLEELRRQENTVFGSTSGASPVVVRTFPLALPEPEAIRIDYRVNPGMMYLLWTTSRPVRTAFPAQQTRFRLVLSTRPGCHQQIAIPAFQRAAGALWLLVYLGGIGTRSRRGLGSLRVVSVDGWPDGLPAVEPTNEGLSYDLERGIAQLQEHLGLVPTSNVTRPVPFDILHPDVCSIYVRTGPTPLWANWKEALESIGHDLSSARKRQPPDYDIVKDVLEHRTPTGPMERAAFGLPMQFYYRSLHRNYTEKLLRQQPNL